MLDFYGILLVVQLVFLIWCCIKTTKRKWICQLSLQGFCTALAIALYIYYEYFTPVTHPGPLGAPYFHETLCRRFLRCASANWCTCSCHPLAEG